MTTRGLAIPLLFVAWFATTAAAQSLSPVDPLPPDARGTPTNTRIPVTSSEAEVLGAEASGITSAAAPISLEQPIDPGKYICGPGDVFEINFWGQQNFRLKIAADLEGRAFISKVGYVPVSGKTLTEVRAQIRKKVGTNYPGLQFDVTLVNPRSFVVHVVDAVKQPGTYTATPLDRLSTILMRAGGVTGSRRRIDVKHRDGSLTHADLVLYEQTGDTAHNPYLLDGDVVEVPPAKVMVSIAGAIRRPGTYELIATQNLNELLQLAGGFSGSVAKDLPIRIVKHDAKQHEVFVDIPFNGGHPADQQLDEDDSVYVRATNELQRSVLLIGAVVGSDEVDAATTSKRLPFIEGDTVRSLIERAGGIRAPGDLSRSYISRVQKDGTSTIVPIDLDALLVRRDFSKDQTIEMGDTLVVPPMRYSVLVEGAVARAGVYYFNPLFGIREYIAHAGGRTRAARDLDEVQLVRPDGKTFKFDSKIKVNPGDAIMVPERNFTRAEVVQIVIAGAGLLLSGVAITLAATR